MKIDKLYWISQDENDCYKYILEEVLDLNESNPTKEYRKKIKGFHLAFNIRDKLDTEISKYKY